MADFLARAVMPVCYQGQGNFALVSLDLTPHQRTVGLTDGSLLELSIQGGEGCVVPGHCQQPAGVQIQAMAGCYARKAGLQPGDQAVLVFGVSPGNTEQQVWFVYQKQVRIGVQYTYTLLAVGHQIWGI